MQIRQLKISHFRGIATLDWTPSHSFCCLIGPGDSGKSTVLDGVEALPSSRWFSFTEPDFLGCDTSTPIIIEATIGELSRALKSDERFGLYIRGWTNTGEIRDEPEDDDEPVLTLRLTVDATMEPVWELVCDRVDDPRTLSNRDRALFGLVRLAGEDARHLGWGQGSVLSRLTGDTDEAAARLAAAYRTARASTKLDEIESLTNAAEAAEGFAKGLGAYVEGAYEPGLELGRSGLSSGSIAQLKADQAKAKEAHKSVGQVLITTHSDVALGEAGADCLRVVQTSRPGRATTLAQPASPAPIQALMRFTPRALFARRILVTEGNTEIGMLLGVRENWPPRHANKPIEQLGVAIADGNGDQACSMALSLASLGYLTAIYRDSDTALSADSQAALLAAGIPIFEYGGDLNTEQALFFAASDELVQELLVYARAERGEDAIDNNLAIKIADLSVEMIRDDFANWDLFTTLDGAQLRGAIAEVAARKKWFKDQRIGRGLAPIVWKIASGAPASPLAQALATVETWLYA